VPSKAGTFLHGLATLLTRTTISVNSDITFCLRPDRDAFWVSHAASTEFL
jgi:hypothetical protein